MTDACRMPAWPAAATTVPVGSLRTLADQVNDMVAARVTHRSSTATASPVRVRRGSVTGRANADAQPLADDPPGDGAGKPDDEHDSAGIPDAGHAEVWTLVRRAQGGDGDAFGLLYDRYVDTVFRFVLYRVHDRALAEDFTSETFLRALRRIGSISYQGRDPGAWFVTIARNIVLDHMKSARHRLEITTDEHPDRAHDGAEHATEETVLRTLQAETLMAAVDELNDEQRECVLLRFIQGMSVNETAQIMGKNDGAIKALQHRAVRKLADLVGERLA